MRKALVAYKIILLLKLADTPLEAFKGFFGGGGVQFIQGRTILEGLCPPPLFMTYEATHIYTHISFYFIIRITLRKFSQWQHPAPIQIQDIYLYLKFPTQIIGAFPKSAQRTQAPSPSFKKKDNQNNYIMPSGLP